ncbi:MAG: ribbon-helix-helix protein, CopG family [Trueperaceae bacterium]|nr:MAG: ribbon-helix-helix protein, CopG family [Trueperaceae bacterium]
MHKTTIYLPEKLRLDIEALARREKRAQAEVIREALERYIASKPKPVASFIGMADDDRVSAAESEDWIHEAWAEEKKH